MHSIFLTKILVMLCKVAFIARIYDLYMRVFLLNDLDKNRFFLEMMAIDDEG